MTWGYLPPAVSEVFLPAVVARLVRGDASGLEDEISRYLGSHAAAAGSSWVLVLRQLLEAIAATRPDRREVILPSYSCNEFTKAVLLAGLRPKYVDVRRDLACDPLAIEGAITRDTLAAFSINNIGRESDNAAVRELCDRHGVVCVEDATYTILGTSDRDHRRFGTYGHYAVLNFSEGKIIPVGGGAVVTNVADGVVVIDRVRAQIKTQPATSSLRDLLSLVVYRAGSSRLGYSAYRLLRQLTGADLKQRLAMEPTRAKEVGHDLERDASGHVALRADRASTLDDRGSLHPLGRPKQLCGVEIIRNADRIRRQRRARHEAFCHALGAVSAVELLPLPAQGMRIKAPLVMLTDLSDAAQGELERLGVCRGYSTDYPTYGPASSPNSNRFFERLFTLPIHRHIHDGIVREITAALAKSSVRKSAAAVLHVQARVTNEVE
jgi:dTDP-4-amino-4,6-dideoxygalactose transaminase